MGSFPETKLIRFKSHNRTIMALVRLQFHCSNRPASLPPNGGSEDEISNFPPQLSKKRSKQSLSYRTFFLSLPTKMRERKKMLGLARLEVCKTVLKGKA